MLTSRTGAAGNGRGARNMPEHLLQRTLSPVMAVCYEQGVAPPTAAEAVASRYMRHIVNGQLRPGAALDELVNDEAAGRAIFPSAKGVRSLGVSLSLLCGIKATEKQQLLLST